ncbi:unnamed protein product [Brachionus calyciflorus]|uniref:Intraflagellar transport 88 n=1 Tax=Brachionus calyciflorus TaxID=104777 RepID=A0A814ATD1_9BILA|nr:unnamed protein product [Brachionus calyciflorus]
MDDEDLYGGYNDDDSPFNTDNLTYDSQFQQAVAKTSAGRRPPPTSMRGLQTTGFNKQPVQIGKPGVPGTAMRRGTASGTGGRPMTAVVGAGFNSSKNMVAGIDPSSSITITLEPKIETEEEKIKNLEKNVSQLAEESCFAAEDNDKLAAMEKAKEAYKKERLILKQREEKNLTDQANTELTGFILLNVACQYANANNFAESLNIYNILTKNKIFQLTGRLKTNIGNIYYEQKQYLKAIKMYRMALDQIPITNQELKLQIHRNIALSFVKMGQFADAATNYEIIFKDRPDLKTGFNLLLCYYALGDRNRMKQCFLELLKIPMKIPDDDDYQAHPTDQQANLVLEVTRDDKLRRYERKKKRQIDHCIVTAVKLIAPAIESDFATGYEFCIEQVKLSEYKDLAHDLDIQKAIVYLKAKNFNMAIETLKDFEKRDVKVASSAATNLSFLYFLENDFQNAHKYADLSLKADKYNPAALTNKGNCFFAEKEYERAKHYYEDALKIDASCVEALYNLGLAYGKIGLYEQALDQFFKLHAMQRSNTQIYAKIAEINSKKSDYDQAENWYMQALRAHPKDSELLKCIGNIYDEQGDRSQAFQYYHDAYRFDPSNLQTIEWLGTYYIDSQYPEKAVEYFEKAALGRPHQVKWHLMVASCYRKSGNYAAALEKYKQIHYRFPENTECIKFLVRICSDLGYTQEAQDYATKLKKAEKMIEVKQARISSSDKRKSIIKGRKSIFEDQDVPLLQHQESKESVTRMSSSRGGSGKKNIDLNTDDTTILENRDEEAQNVQHQDFLGHVPRPQTSKVRKNPNPVTTFDVDAADLLPD